jgi:formyltetrahydrofolate deformylase
MSCQIGGLSCLPHYAHAWERSSTPMTAAPRVRAATKASAIREYVLTLACADAPGIVYAVTGFLVRHSGNILASQQFDDRDTGLFFMRVHFEVLDDSVTLEALRRGADPVAASFGATWELHEADSKYRVLIMVSKFGHCLNDLLFRYTIGALNIEIPAIVSNHEDFAALAAWHGIPYHHIPVTAATKASAEAELLGLVERYEIDLVVLARYMQVLSDGVCKALDGRAINIHHSFLPSFRGARPYHQAHERGVKLIGATAHYVTAVLDEGPIIEQEVIRVDHSTDPGQLIAAGRDVECQALARAVKWHTEQRILRNGHRTVVFR